MRKNDPPLSASLEDYLEAIFVLSRDKPVARSKDIANAVGVTRPSVTGALQALTEKGLIHYAPYDTITLTPAGRDLAADIVTRHDVLRGFLVSVLGVDAETADREACRMEHALSAEVLARLVAYVERVGPGGARRRRTKRSTP